MNDEEQLLNGVPPDDEKLYARCVDFARRKLAEGAAFYFSSVLDESRGEVFAQYVPHYSHHVMAGWNVQIWEGVSFTGPLHVGSDDDGRTWWIVDDHGLNVFPIPYNCEPVAGLSDELQAKIEKVMPEVMARVLRRGHPDPPLRCDVQAPGPASDPSQGPRVGREVRRMDRRTGGRQGRAHHGRSQREGLGGGRVNGAMEMRTNRFRRCADCRRMAGRHWVCVRFNDDAFRLLCEGCYDRRVKSGDWDASN